MNKRKKN